MSNDTNAGNTVAYNLNTSSGAAATWGQNQTGGGIFSAFAISASTSGSMQPGLSSLQCSPTSLNSGASSTCTVTLSQAAPTGGATITLSSSNSTLTVQPSVTVTAGTMSATFNATTGTIPSDSTATITATYNDTSANTSLSLSSVTVGITASTLVCSPSSLGPNSSSNCTVNLSGAAPSGGATVTLSSSNSALTVPRSVAVAAAATSASFSATTAAISSNGRATLTAGYNGSSATTSVSLLAPVLVSTMACSPSSLGANSSSRCSVTLTQSAPSGGATVTLSSSNSALTIPASVSVAAAAMSASFSATTAAINSNASATVTASYNSSSATASLSLVASVLVSSLACSPSSLGPNSSTTCTVTLTQPAPSGGASVTLSNSNPTLTVPASVTVTSAATSAAFGATTAAVSSNASSTITATYNSSSATTSVSLVAPVSVSSLSCNPTSLGPNASGVGTVTLTQPAPTGGASVSLTNSNPTLTVPASVTVAASATTATFSATTAAISSNASATVTASYNNTSASATVSLVAPVSVSSLACSPTNLPPNAASTCTVTLTQAAPSGGSSIALSSNNGALTVPSSVTVPAGSTTATFNVTDGVVQTNQTVTVTGSLNGQAATATLTVLAQPVTVSTLQCTPANVASGSSAACTVTLSGAAPTGGSSVALSSNNRALTVPASVNVAAGSTTATFNAAAGTVTANQVVSSTTMVGGVGSPKTTSAINTTGATSLWVAVAHSCSPLTVTISDSAGNTWYSTPAASNKGNNGTQIFYSYNVTTSTSHTFTATFTGTCRLNIAAIALSGTLTTSSVLDTSAQGTTLRTTVEPGSITPAQTGETFITAFSGNGVGGSGISIGNGFTISGSATSGWDGGMAYLLTSGTSAQNPTWSFTGDSILSASMVAVRPAAASGSATVTASLNGQAATASLTITAQSNTTLQTGAAASVHVQPAGTSTVPQKSSTTPPLENAISGLYCAPKAIDAGGKATCELQVAANATPSAIQLTSTSQQVKVPASVVTRANQTRLTFQVSADAAARQQLVTVAAMAGTATVQDTIQVAAASQPIVIAPNSLAGKRGAPVRFTVSAADPTELPVQLTASNLPVGATFDATSGGFEWTPAGVQAGKYKVTFTAMNPAGQSSSKQVTIDVTSGDPTLATVERACSPGAVASVTGSWLAEPGPAISDPSGNAMELGGTKVQVNGQYVPVVSVSPAEVQFICPSGASGSQLAVSVETEVGASGPLNMVMASASPWIFPIGASDQTQGVITFVGTTDLAMARNAQVAAHPAQPGDEILLWGTGFGSSTEDWTGRVSVTLGGVDAQVDGVSAVPGHAGVYAVQVRVPVPMVFGAGVPVQLQVRGPDGKPYASNKVTMAVEPVSQ